ncbi:MAG: ABC transporter permease, partial [Atopobiaceae bacterium]|nr:ABC transporter permease [Atopobiaceae bacterium]
SVASYKQNSERIDHIAEVFPLMFFLVAALVALTTMTRMVEEERVEIGTHKALGFTTAQITMKYVSYALLAGLAGSVVGILILSQVLPYVVIIAYNIMYGIPLPPFPIPIDLSIAFMATVAGVGITLIATWGAAAATLREVPAQLMLPRAPAAGKRILLEHITPIWKRMSFTWKVTMRNLFRYKRRLAMTIIGIAGCTALLLTGLGLHDSIWDIIDNQFEGPDPIVHYSVMVGFDEEIRPEQREEARKVLEETGEATVLTFAENENMQAGSARSKDNVAVSVLIPLDCDSFTETITMRDRITGAPIEMDGSSVIITEKAANILGVRAGDTITLYEQDDIGNAIGSGYAFTIDAVTESYVRHFLYVGNDAWKEVMGEGMEPNMVLANVRDEEEVRLEVSRSLHDVGGISTVSFNSEAIQTYRQSLSSVNMIVVVLVVAAAALAFIVLYNLTNINIVERTREIASLKVLGFTRIDVAIYVFREVFLLVIMGAVLGLGLGTVLEGFVVKAAEVDVVMFGRDIHPPSYLIAFVVTLVFTGLVMLAMLPKLRSIDMVESLKSVD